MKYLWTGIVGTAVLVGVLPTLLVSQTTRNSQAPGPYRRIAVMWARDEGHSVDMEAGYIRHLEWYQEAKDPFAWYSYSVWASTERQRWIIYATFGHTAAELSDPVSPAEDERDSMINILPHVQFTGNAIYEFLPSPSRGTGVPAPTPRAEYMTVELKSAGAGVAVAGSAVRGDGIGQHAIFWAARSCEFHSRRKGDRKRRIARR